MAWEQGNYSSSVVDGEGPQAQEDKSYSARPLELTTLISCVWDSPGAPGTQERSAKYEPDSWPE